MEATKNPTTTHKMCECSHPALRPVPAFMCGTCRGDVQRDAEWVPSAGVYLAK